MTARVFSIDPVIGFVPFTLTGHRNALVNCFFDENSLNVSFSINNYVCYIISIVGIFIIQLHRVIVFLLAEN